MSEIHFSTRAKYIIVATLVAIALFVLFKASHIIIPFVWAVVTAYLFTPVVSFFSRRTNVPRVAWVLLLYIVLILSLAWVMLRFVPMVTAQLSQLAREVPSLLNSAESVVGAQGSIDILGVTIPTAGFDQQITQWISEAANFLSRGALGLIVSLATVIVDLFVYAFATFYLLLDGDRIVEFFKSQVPARYRPEINAVFIRINRVLSAFIRGQLMLIVIMSSATYIILSILQVKYALLLALATGFLELIPFVGPYAAGGLSASVAFLQPTTPFGWSNFFLVVVVAIAYFVLRQLEDNLVIPNLIGSLVELHPLVVLFVILAGASFGGITGLFLAVPTTAVAKIIFSFLYPKLVDKEPPERIWVQPDESVETAMSKVASVSARNVVLMIPEEDHAIAGAQSLKQLRDSSRKAKVNLSIACPSDEVCYRAEKIGIKAHYDFNDTGRMEDIKTEPVGSK